MALELAPLVSAIETVGEKFESWQPRKLLTRRDRALGDLRSNDPIARRRRDVAASDNPALVPAKPNHADLGFEQRRPGRRAIPVKAADFRG